MTPTIPPAAPPAPMTGFRSNWQLLHTLALVGMIVLLVIVVIVNVNGNIPALITWLTVLVLLTGLMILISHGITGMRFGLLIDERNKMSLSRLQMAMWTLVILSALFAGVIVNLKQEITRENAFAIQMPDAIWVMMGISTISLVGSPLIKTVVKGDQIQKNGDAHQASPSDWFKGEETENFTQLDLSKVQMFLFTIILVVGYAVALGAKFSTGSLTAFPAVDSSMVALLGVSHAGYLTSKAMPRGQDGNTPTLDTSTTLPHEDLPPQP